MGLNQFTAFTQEEFESRYLGAQLPADFHPLVGDEGIAVPNDVDWVSQGKVSPIKNQGACGSCWAFSATGVMESWSLFNGKAVSLSEQQLVDCSRSYGNQGCNGGWPSSALNYVKDKGITSESDYPYKAHTNSCVKNGGDFHIAGYSSYSGCTNLANALASHPVSVTVDARNWPHYASGVFTNCGSQIDHAVLAVGMTSSYWKIKNSWGTSWGESGYIRIGSGNTCGICHYPGIYPYWLISEKIRSIYNIIIYSALLVYFLFLTCCV